MTQDSLRYMADAVVPAAYKLLPEKMESKAATCLMLATMLQESRGLYRKQIQGPAVSYFQFEKNGGILGVLEHPITRPIIQGVLRTLNYDFSPITSYEALVHNDILATCYARLFYWTNPAPLPSIDDVNGMLNYYIKTWRPGRPRVDTFPLLYSQAKEVVNGRASDH